MPAFGRSVVALLILVLASIGGAGICSGWQPSAEARMACCADGGCGMSHEARDGTSGTPLTQQAADSCCAMGEGRSTSAPVASVDVGVPILAVTGLPPTTLLRTEDVPRFYHRVPLSSGVARHVLLTVFRI